MFKNSSITRAVRQCTNRYVTQKLPCKYPGIYPRLISNQQGVPKSQSVRPTKWPGSLSSMTAKTGATRIGRRSVQTTGQNGNSHNTLLFVGLGAFGVASGLAWKMELFNTTSGGKKSSETGQKDAVLSADNVASQEEVTEASPTDDEGLLDECPVEAETAEAKTVDAEGVDSDASKGDITEPEEEDKVDIGEQIKEEVSEIAEKAKEVVENIKETVEEVKETVAEKVKEEETKREAAVEATHKIADKINEEAHEIADKINEEVHEIAEQVKEVVHDIKGAFTEIKEDVAETINEYKEEVKEELKEIYEGSSGISVPKEVHVEEQTKVVEKEGDEKIDAMKEEEPLSKEAKPAVPKPEVKVPKIPSHVPYLIIGAGTASHAACRAIRKNDPNAKILVIGDEEVLPYMRPPLSKELWFSDDDDAVDTLYFKQWNGKKRSVFFEDDTYYTKPQHLLSKENAATAVLTGHRVVKVDSKNNTILLKHGEEIKYDKLLIATGGHPKNHGAFENAPDAMKNKFTLFRSVADYRKLDKLVGNLDSVTVIGGGFLGSELACALAAKSKKSGMTVSQVFHEDGNMGKVLPKYLSEWATRKVQSEGVQIHPQVDVMGATVEDAGKVVLQLSNGEQISTGHVVVCVGIEPNTELALTAGLEVDKDFGGFRVNSELQAKSDIWIAGDVSCFYDEKLGRRRVEHHDHAVVSGRLAGENMTGAKKSYTHQSMFWSDLGPNIGYEAIGIVDNNLDTVGVWAKATKQDTPKAIVEQTGESLRSKSEQDAETGEAVVPPTLSVVGEATTVEDASGDSEEFGKGIVFYLRDDTVVGVLLWNIFNKMPVARKILKEGRKHNDLSELAKLFNIHE
eukprot:gene10892-12048_t